MNKLQRSLLIEKYARSAVDSMDLDDLITFALETISNALDNSNVDDYDVLEEIYDLECCGDVKLFTDFCDDVVDDQVVQEFLNERES